MTARQADAVDVLLVGYEGHENLGLRSILACLLARGRTAALVPFFPGQLDVVSIAARRLRPRVVGFSLIFQYSLDQFGALMRALRADGVQAHFTAGGHFPSLLPRETLALLPELDSIVRFEGEETLLELLERLDRPAEWGQVEGLAFRAGTAVHVNPPRPLIADLDALPFVYRDEVRLAAPGIPMAAMLASRGCLFNCSFCSIRQFYAGADGALRRARSPRRVVEEMQALHDARGVRFFSFQDDDFAAHTGRDRRWMSEFLRELRACGLSDRVRWKISCRVDDLHGGILDDMIGHGLMAVYLGVESGSAAGLRTLNKHVSVEQNLAAVDLLKGRQVALSIGFMLFDPSSTADTIRENITFLRQVGDDGYFPVNFCKMLPYAGTPIEGHLRRSGRLKGTVLNPDYDFLDPRLDSYAYLVQRIFMKRNFASDGAVAVLQRLDFDERLTRSFTSGAPGAAAGSGLPALIARSNRSAVETLERLLDAVTQATTDRLLDEQDALALAEREWRTENEIEVALRRMGAAVADGPAAAAGR